MSESLWFKLADWNDRMNGIPRKCLLIAITLLCAALVFALFPYCWPFVVALVFSMVLEPFVRLVSKGLQQLKMARSAATLLGMLILFGLVGILAVATIGRLWRELMGLVRAVPGVISWISATVLPWARGLYAQYQDILPAYVMDMINNALASVGQSLGQWAASLSKVLTSGAWTTAMSLMDVVLSIVLTIMGTYYLTADKSRIAAFFRRTFPQDVRRHSVLIKTNLVKALFGQLKSQLTVSSVIILFLVTFFIIFGVRYGLLAALLIGLADALPVVGAGLFLIPWSILSFVLGDVGTGILMACMYLGTIVIRQVLEPRIVGKNLGLYPLATMIAMYAGYHALGFLGLLGGPIMLSLIKVVLEADKAVAGPGPGAESAAPPPASPVVAQPKTDGELTLPNGKKKPFRVKGGDKDA